MAPAIIEISRAGATRLSGAGPGNCRSLRYAISDPGNREAIMSVIATIEQLEAIYGHPNDASTVKVADRVTPAYRVLIDKSPFAALATCGPEGLDCSPRGDLPGFVRIHDEKTLMMPDRRGNNRVDSLRNIVRDPRIALLFLIPGSGSTLRVNGKPSYSRGTCCRCTQRFQQFPLIGRKFVIEFVVHGVSDSRSSCGA
jgi:predicted pyridoxine 5'-phosphate oxidase superfamily flavin-nucleotide-binding protein